MGGVEAFGAVLVQPGDNPMKLDYGTPSVSGLALAFGFGFGFAFDHAQPPRTNSGSFATLAAIIGTSTVEEINSDTSHVAGSSHTDNNSGYNIDTETPTSGV